MSDASWMDRDDAVAYIMRYPVVMLEETGGLPLDGNFQEIYINATTVGVSNKRNIKKGKDVKYDDIYKWHVANFGFRRNGEFLPAILDTYKNLGLGFIGPQDNNQPRAVPSGPINFFELAVHWYTFQKKYVDGNQCPPLFIKLKLNANDELHVQYKGVLTRYGNVKGRLGPGLDRDVHNFRIVFPLENYCCAGGDVLSLNRNVTTVTALYAHKSICATATLPAPNDKLYQQIGLFYTEGDRVVVLRTALHKNITEQNLTMLYAEHYGTKPATCKKTQYGVTTEKPCDEMFTEPRYFSKSTAFNISNGFQVNNPFEFYALLTNPKTIFDGIISGLMSSKGNLMNLTWKGLNDLDFSQTGNRYLFFSGLCSQSPVIAEYPYICACLGNGNEEALFKQQDPNFSFFCNSAKCLNSNGLDVFKYTPTVPPECPTVFMCDQRLEGNVFTFVKVDKSRCTQTVDGLSTTTSVKPIDRGHTHGAVFAVLMVFVVLVAIAFYMSNKNTV